jgi:hypothetical protein
MASRPRPRRLWPFILALTALALFVGWAIGGTMGGRVPPRIPFLYRAPAAASTDSAADPSAMSRGALEREVRRLREEIALKNRRLDDLTIEMKILTEGSRTDR